MYVKKLDFAKSHTMLNHNYFYVWSGTRSYCSWMWLWYDIHYLCHRYYIQGPELQVKLPEHYPISSRTILLIEEVMSEVLQKKQRLLSTRKYIQWTRAALFQGWATPTALFSFDEWSIFTSMFCHKLYLWHVFSSFTSPLRMSWSMFSRTAEVTAFLCKLLWYRFSIVYFYVSDASAINPLLVSQTTISSCFSLMNSVYRCKIWSTVWAIIKN